MKLFTITFIVINICLASASFLTGKNQNAFAQIQSLEKSDFGKKLMDTIALQMENKAPLEDVAKLLKDLQQNLEDQQAQSDKEHAQQEAHCKSEDERLVGVINKASQRISESTQEIHRLNNEIKQNHAIIENRKRQLQILDQRERQLDNDHDRDQEAYKKRIAEHQSVIEALDIIIPKLESIKGQPAPQAAAVLSELNKIGSNNPIAALVSVATSLDANALQNVIVKLREIRDGVSYSLSQDTKAQQESDAQYAQLKNEIDSVRTTNQQELSQEQSTLAQNESAKKTQEQILKDNTELKADSEKELADLRQKCEEQRQQYQADKKQRNEEVSIVVQVINILANRIQTMKEYLKERVNQ